MKVNCELMVRTSTPQEKDEPGDDGKWPSVSLRCTVVGKVEDTTAAVRGMTWDSDRVCVRSYTIVPSISSTSNSFITFEADESAAGSIEVETAIVEFSLNFVEVQPVLQLLTPRSGDNADKASRWVFHMAADILPVIKTTGGFFEGYTVTKVTVNSSPSENAELFPVRWDNVGAPLPCLVDDMWAVITSLPLPLQRDTTTALPPAPRIVTPPPNSDGLEPMVVFPSLLRPTGKSRNLSDDEANDFASNVFGFVASVATEKGTHPTSKVRVVIMEESLGTENDGCVVCCRQWGSSSSTCDWSVFFVEAALILSAMGLIRVCPHLQIHANVQVATALWRMRQSTELHPRTAMPVSRLHHRVLSHMVLEGDVSPHAAKEYYHWMGIRDRRNNSVPKRRQAPTVPETSLAIDGPSFGVDVRTEIITANLHHVRVQVTRRSPGTAPGVNDEDCHLRVSAVLVRYVEGSIGAAGGSSEQTVSIERPRVVGPVATRQVSFTAAADDDVAVVEFLMGHLHDVVDDADTGMTATSNSRSGGHGMFAAMVGLERLATGQQLIPILPEFVRVDGPRAPDHVEAALTAAASALFNDVNSQSSADSHTRGSVWNLNVATISAMTATDGFVGTPSISHAQIVGLMRQHHPADQGTGLTGRTSCFLMAAMIRRCRWILGYALGTTALSEGRDAAAMPRNQLLMSAAAETDVSLSKMCTQFLDWFKSFQSARNRMIVDPSDFWATCEVQRELRQAASLLSTHLKGAHPVVAAFRCELAEVLGGAHVLDSLAENVPEDDDDDVEHLGGRDGPGQQELDYGAWKNVSSAVVGTDDTVSRKRSRDSHAVEKSTTVFSPADVLGELSPAAVEDVEEDDDDGFVMEFE